MVAFEAMMILPTRDCRRASEALAGPAPFSLLFSCLLPRFHLWGCGHRLISRHYECGRYRSGCAAPTCHPRTICHDEMAHSIDRPSCVIKWCIQLESFFSKCIWKGRCLSTSA